MAFEDFFNEVNQDLPPCLLQKEIQDFKKTKQPPSILCCQNCHNRLKMRTSVLERSSTWMCYHRLPV